jgi:CheY-like chemotaxis protein
MMIANQPPILLVEDDARLTTILTRLIDTLGFKVSTVDSGEKALEYLKQARPAGIFLDLGLPGMQGIEVLQCLKAEPNTSTIPVFIMSGSVDTGEAKTLGAVGFLKKPINKEAILAAIHSMLKQQHALLPSPRTVLVIEDNDIELLGLKNLFQGDPLNLVTVKTGAAGLQWLTRNSADAIILDLMLPDISGFEWLKQFSSLAAQPPVVIYSARELSADELFQLRVHAEAIVTKGKNNERLREEVLRLFSLKHHVVEAEKPTIMPSAGSGFHQRVLLVDDDVRNLFALSKVLRQKGFQVEIAPSAVKALEILEKQPIDVLLADIMMPEMDGYALIRRVRELGYVKLPIIAVTAKAMLGDVDLCLQAGANDYIPKPVDISRMLEVLKRWL